MVINGIPGGPHGSEFGMYLTTILSKVFYTQRIPIFIKLKLFGGFWGVIKLPKYYIAMYIYSPIVTRVTPPRHPNVNIGRASEPEL